MLPDRVSNPGPLTYESGALPIALRGRAWPVYKQIHWEIRQNVNERRDMMQNVNKSRDMILRFK